MKFVTFGVKGKLNTFDVKNICRLELTTTLKSSVLLYSMPQVKVYLANQIENAVIVNYDYASDDNIRFLSYGGIYRSQELRKDNVFAVAESDFHILDGLIKRGPLHSLEKLLDKAFTVCKQSLVDARIL